MSDSFGGGGGGGTNEVVDRIGVLLSRRLADAQDKLDSAARAKVVVGARIDLSLLTKIPNVQWNDRFGTMVRALEAYSKGGIKQLTEWGAVFYTELHAALVLLTTSAGDRPIQPAHVDAVWSFYARHRNSENISASPAFVSGGGLGSARPAPGAVGSRAGRGGGVSGGGGGEDGDGTASLRMLLPLNSAMNDSLNASNNQWNDRPVGRSGSPQRRPAASDDATARTGAFDEGFRPSSLLADAAHPAAALRGDHPPAGSGSRASDRSSPDRHAAPGESVVAPGGSSTRQNFVAPEHLEYARELQAAGMQQAEFDRVREEVAGLKREKLAAVSSGRAPQAAPLSPPRSDDGRGHTGRDAGRSNGAPVTATSVPSLDPFRPWASPRHIAPQEVLASTPKRVLYETYLYTQDRLYPQPPPEPERKSMRDDPNLLPPRPEIDDPRTRVLIDPKYLAAPGPTAAVTTARLLAGRRNAKAAGGVIRPDAAPTLKRPLTPGELDQRWIGMRLRDAFEVRYSRQVEDGVAAWARLRARMEEESVRRQESSRFASQTGIAVVHSAWTPVDNSMPRMPRRLGKPRRRTQGGAKARRKAAAAAARAAEEEARKAAATAAAAAAGEDTDDGAASETGSKPPDGIAVVDAASVSSDEDMVFEDDIRAAFENAQALGGIGNQSTPSNRAGAVQPPRGETLDHDAHLLARNRLFLSPYSNRPDLLRRRDGTDDAAEDGSSSRASPSLRGGSSRGGQRPGSAGIGSLVPSMRRTAPPTLDEALADARAVGFLPPHAATMTPDMPAPRKPRTIDVVREREAERRRLRKLAKEGDGNAPRRRTTSSYVPSRNKKKKPRPLPPHVPSLVRSEQAEEAFALDKALQALDVSLADDVVERGLWLPEDRLPQVCLRALPRPNERLAPNPNAKKKKRRPRRAKAGGGGARRPISRR